MDGWLAIAPGADTGNPDRLRSRVVPGGLSRTLRADLHCNSCNLIERCGRECPRLHDENGRGVARDRLEAGRWYRQAAEQGHELLRRDESAFVDG